MSMGSIVCALVYCDVAEISVRGTDRLHITNEHENLSRERE